MDWWKVAAGAAQGYGGAVGNVGKIAGSLMDRRKKKRRPSDPLSQPSAMRAEYSEDYMPQEEGDEY